MGIFSPYYTNNNKGNNQDTTTDTKSILDPLTDSSNKCCLTCESCDNPPFLEENGKIINQNCKTCIKGYNLLFATKDCYNSSILKEGYYLSSNDSMYHKCDIQCKTCKENSQLNKSICISCNYNKGFYTAEKKSPSNCYNRTTIDANYYLNKDITNKKWALCYTSCGSCDSAGNNSIHNCKSCKKNYYPLFDNISDDEKLIIVNMEQKYNKTRENKNDENSSVDLGKNMQIEVYDISGKKLDLSVCKEEIKVMKYIGDVEELNIDLTKELSNQGIDAFNRNDKFFNDICHSLKNRSQDIILKDRVADIYQNVDLCQKGCVYNGMNYTLKIANCICDSSMLQLGIDNKTNTDNKKDVEEKVDLKGIKSIIKSSLEQINFNVISCSNLVFDEKY